MVGGVVIDVCGAGRESRGSLDGLHSVKPVGNSSKVVIAMMLGEIFYNYTMQIIPITALWITFDELNFVLNFVPSTKLLIQPLKHELAIRKLMFINSEQQLMHRVEKLLNVRQFKRCNSDVQQRHDRRTPTPFSVNAEAKCHARDDESPAWSLLTRNTPFHVHGQHAAE